MTPAFGQVVEQNGTMGAIALLRYSLFIEASAALIILGLVAWLGTLEPPMSI